MTPKHAGPSEKDWDAEWHRQNQERMQKSVTRAAVQWAKGERSAHSLKTRVQYWLRRVARSAAGREGSNHDPEARREHEDQTHIW